MTVFGEWHKTRLPPRHRRVILGAVIPSPHVSIADRSSILNPGRSNGLPLPGGKPDMTDTEKMKKHITSTKRLGEVLLSPLAVITMRSRSRWRILRMDASSGETNRPWLQRGTRLAEAAMAAHDEKEDFAFRASNGFAVMSEGERRIQTQPHLTARLPLHQGRSKFRAGRGLFLPLLPGSE